MKKYAIAVGMAAAILSNAASSLWAQSLIQIGSYSELVNATGVISRGNYAFVSDRSLGLVVMDISNPSVPTAVGRYDPPLEIYDMKIIGDTIFLATGVYEPYSGALEIVDVTTKTAPTLLGSISFSWEAIAIAAFYDSYMDRFYAYVSIYGGIKIIDLADISDPVVVGNFESPGGALDMEYFLGWLHIAAGNSGLHVLDAFNPTTPVFLGTCNTPGIAYDAAIEANWGTIAYVADGDSGLTIINIYDYANPRIIGRVGTVARATRVVVDSALAYVALGDSGFAVMAINNPSHPSLLASTDTPGRVKGISLVGNYIAVAGGASLGIYQLVVQECDYIPGDINHNGAANGIDVVYAVSYLRGGNPPPVDCSPPCSGGVPDPFYAAMDVNGNCQVNGIDVMYYVAFLGGQQPRLRYCLNCWPNR